MSALPAMPVKGQSGVSCLIQQKSTIMPPIRQSQIAKYKIHLISDKDVREHNLQMNIKELSKEETALYRNSHKQTVCIAMLREGYHKSFSELFTLIERWNALREAAGPGSTIWQQKSLEEQTDKLDQLQHFLTRAEAAQRAGHYEEAYTNQHALAKYFQKSGDDWLSNHFFECCFTTSQFIKVDGGRKEAEANENLGKVCEENSQLEKAAEHYEAFYHLTVGRKWTDETGRTQNSLACESLWRVYTLLADKMLENKEHKPAIKTLIKAFTMAKEGGDKKMEGSSAYRLGLAYLAAGQPQTAISTLNAYLNISEELGDIVGLGKAYEAIAKSLQSQGKILDSIQYLEKFIEIAKSNNMGQSLIEACTYLGEIYNTSGNYEKACDYFAEAYETATNLTDPLLLEVTQLHYGIGQAHKMMAPYCSHTEVADHPCIKLLVAWKESRSGMFAEPAPAAMNPVLEPRSRPIEQSCIQNPSDPVQEAVQTRVPC
ncbi:tetratricopeptide repeat protein 29 isoform X2 [Ambystoma mexicanum]|uniref:tetratricopeptide repeat protein 29 isoform X2 n=1 Tax=Ambystoma mexicanum TaxID=8296 RepID=UPI0037E9C970